LQGSFEEFAAFCAVQASLMNLSSRSVGEAEVREQHRVVPREMNAKAEDAQQASGISGTLPATEGTPSSSAGAGKAWARLEFEDGRTIAVHGVRFSIGRLDDNDLVVDDGRLSGD